MYCYITGYMHTRADSLFDVCDIYIITFDAILLSIANSQRCVIKTAKTVTGRSHYNARMVEVKDSPATIHYVWQ